MKKYLVVLISLVVGMFLASNAIAIDPGAYVAGEGVVGSVHDLGTAHDGMAYTADPADPLERICIFCHTPHHSYKLSELNGGPAIGVGSGDSASDEFTYLPLWNHELTGNAGLYVTYWNGPDAPTTGAKASQAIANGMTIGGMSLLCLSCHDGSIAVNSYGNTDQPATSQSSGGGTIGAGYVIGQDNYLGNHHPIGFNYDDVAIDDTEIISADVAVLGAAGDVRSHLYGAGNTMMECGTCHSVHNKGNTGETLLWTTDAASGLCLSCHDK